MNEKINIAELLKDCPSGMELDCTMYEDVCFDFVDERNMIHCFIQHEAYKTSVIFNQHGTPNSITKSKCVIFPKGETTWEGFQRPFNDGDIVATTNGSWIGITLGGKVRDERIPTYCVIKSNGEFEAYLDTKERWAFSRLATEEEKQKLFKAIKDNGYKWNPETKTLEKLIEQKFKVGDWVEFKYYEREPAKVIRIENNVYYLSSGHTFMFQDESAWDLTTKKFDITDFKPFDKVLVRDDNIQKWSADLFGFVDKRFRYLYSCVGNYAHQCIPYKGNERLLGTTNDCDDYYKTWE